MTIRNIGLTMMLVPMAMASAWAIEVDGIAAKVGSETILKSDIMLEMHRANAPEDAYKTFLEEAIDRKLIIKAAQEAKMTMQEWVIESRIREIIQRAFNGDRNQLMETLSKQKISYPEWYARMKDDMIVAAMRWNVIDKNVSASPSAMRKEFKQFPERYVVKPKTTVAVILLKPTDVARKDEIKLATTKEPFGELAKRYSSDSRAEEGGLWKDVVITDVFKPEICTAIDKLSEGEISDWVEIDDWNFLVKKISEVKGHACTFEEAYDDIEANVKESEAKKAYQEWLKRLREETFVEVY